MGKHCSWNDGGVGGGLHKLHVYMHTHNPDPRWPLLKTGSSRYWRLKTRLPRAINVILIEHTRKVIFLESCFCIAYFRFVYLRDSLKFVRGVRQESFSHQRCRLCSRAYAVMMLTNHKDITWHWPKQSSVWIQISRLHFGVCSQYFAMNFDINYYYCHPQLKYPLDGKFTRDNKGKFLAFFSDNMVEQVWKLFNLLKLIRVVRTKRKGSPKKKVFYTIRAIWR